MIPQLLKQYPLGADITIMNTFYQHPVWNDGKKLSDDFIILVYKDNITHKKHYCIINKPEYTYYIAKPGTELDYSQLFVPKDSVEEVTVPFTDLEYDIAKKTNNVDFYKENIRNKDRARNAELHKDPRIFFSDVNIEDHYRFKFAMTYSNNIEKLNKAFFDIETDLKYCPTEFPERGNCPINAVSFLDEASNHSYTFLLRNKDNPLIEEFENEIKTGKFTIEDIRNFVEEHTKNKEGKSQTKKFGLVGTDYSILFFDNEIELISSLFSTMHKCSPDFIEGWNCSAFDIQFIIDRVIELGYDPAEILCDQSWPVKIVKNYIDVKNLNMLPERGDFTFISGLPIFIDQEIQYASRRKAKYGSINSFKLDDIGYSEAQIHKLDYHHITHDIGKLPYLDYKTFVLYNIMDVIVQKAIEVRTNDLEYIFSKCVVNNTIYRKGHRQSVYLINRMANDWYKMGYIIGNNQNKNSTKPTRFSGALVQDPCKTNDYSKMKLNGRSIWICDNLQDYDFKSLYPSLMLEFNIATNTQIGRIEVYNRWKVRLKKGKGDQVFYVKDAGNAHEFEYGDIKEGNKIIKIRKKVSLYLDPEFTKPVAEDIDYISEDYETLEYDKVYEHENAFNFDKYTRGGEFVDNLVTDNEIEFCHRWLHLANFEEFLIDIDEYYKQNSIGAYSDFDKPNCPIRPSTSISTNDSIKEGNKHIKPIRFLNIPERSIN